MAENAPVPLVVRDTVPDGVIAVPVEVSVTVAVQLEPWFTTTEETHVRLIEVARRVTVMLTGLLVLGA